MKRTEVLEATVSYIKQRLGRETNGRDWWHVWRVWQMAKKIAATEPTADLFTVELAALTHDLAHWQLSGDGEHTGPREVADLLKDLDVNAKTTTHVQRIIRDTKFKGSMVKPQLSGIEAKIIHDADKLDSLGALGIAKTFTYGGTHERPLYDPAIPHGIHASLGAYKSGDTTSINHFYEKNLLLKDRMQTKKGRNISIKRHEFLEQYLEEFYAEWSGRR
ncbi:metal dependent phosphohydrolase [candidate division TM7 genomosp. GTL1]|nr:metal dependent phosphohydrolase [candidate division TM7 genomosp. GTL1]